MKPKRIFLDTEFSNLSQNRKLISIGLVSEVLDLSESDSFYAELGGWEFKDCSQFVIDHVIPQLEYGHVYGRDWDRVADDLHAWLLRQGPCIISTDSLNYDFFWFQQLMRGKWPANVELQPLLLTMNYLTDYDAFCTILEGMLQQGPQHHALFDASMNRQAWFGSGKDTL